MDTFHLRIFQRQVLDQCQFLLFSAQDLHSGVLSQNSTRAIYAIQNLLNAAANISKMLWGQKGKHSEARKPLRDSIGISDDSPLRKVTMRNHFEHMDERIDRWWAESEDHNHIDMIVGPRAAFDFDTAQIDMFRIFDPSTADVVFWGEEHNLEDLIQEVQQIMPKLQEEAGKPHFD